MSGLQILTGDCRDILPMLEAGSVQCCVTSPPYWGLRDYGTAQWEGGEAGCDHTEIYYEGLNGKETPGGRGGSMPHRERQYKDVCPKCSARRIDSQLGLEESPDAYIANMVAVFREVWRVLRDDGTLWLNLGDSYGRNQGNGFDTNSDGGIRKTAAATLAVKTGLKPKDLCMMPARVALALQADGWYLRSDIIWHKPNPMPESVTDRPTKAHEYIFLLTKNGGRPLLWRARDTGEWSYDPDLEDIDPDGNPIWRGFDYFYDAEAIREPQVEPWRSTGKVENGDRNNQGWDGNGFKMDTRSYNANGRNKRSVWTIATQPYAEAHFATFPEEIPKLCILAGSKPGDTILDPFGGSGTVGKVALELGRKSILIDLNPEYIELAKERTFVTPGFL